MSVAELTIHAAMTLQISGSRIAPVIAIRERMRLSPTGLRL